MYACNEHKAMKLYIAYSANTTILASPLGTTLTSAPIEYTHVFLYTKSEVSQSSVYN